MGNTYQRTVGSRRRTSVGGGPACQRTKSVRDPGLDFPSALRRTGTTTPDYRR